MKRILKIHLFFVIASLLSCNRESKLISVQSTKNYSTELIRRVQSDSASLIYILNGYEKRDDKEYLNITIKGENLNIETLILVQNWHKLEEIKRTKAVGYKGVSHRLTPSFFA